MSQNIQINVGANPAPAVAGLNQVGSSVGNLSVVANQVNNSFTNMTNNMTVNLKQVQQQAAQTGSQLGALQQRVASLATSLLLYRGMREVFQVIEDGTGQVIQFQTAMLKVEALTETSAEAASKYAVQIRGMATEGQRSAVELANGLYYIASAGFSSSDAMTVLQATQKASNAGFGEMTTISNATASALQAYHMSASRASEVTDIFASAIVDGKLEADDFAKSIGRVLPIASALHVPLTQVTSAIAAMTNQGLNTEEATTALRGFFNELMKPSSEATKQLEALGLTAGRLRAMLADPSQGLPAVLQLVYEKTNGNVEALDKLIPNVRALTGFYAIAGDSLGDYVRILGHSEEAHGRVDKALAVTSQGVQYQAAQFKNAIIEIGLAAGDQAEGGIAGFLKGMNEGIQAANEHARSAQLAAQLAAQSGNAASTAGTSAGSSTKGWEALGAALAIVATNSGDIIYKMSGLAGLVIIMEGFAKASEMALSARNALDKTLANGDGFGSNLNYPREVPLANRGLGKDQDYYTTGHEGVDAGGYMEYLPVNKPTPDNVNWGNAKPPAQQATSTQTAQEMLSAARATAALSSESQKLEKIMATIWSHPGGTEVGIYEKELKAMSEDIAKQEQAWVKALPPAEANARIAQLDAAYRRYSDAVYTENAESVKAAAENLDSILQVAAGHDLATEKAKQRAAEERRIEAERKRAAAEAKRESQTAASGFELGMNKVGSLFGETDKLGDVRQAATAALDAAMEAENGPGAVTAGAGVMKSVKTLVDRMRKDAIPDFEELGTAYADAMLTALKTKSAGDTEAALAIQNQVLDAIRQAETLTSAKVMNQGPVLSSGSQSLMDSIAKGIQHDTPEAERSIQDAMNRINFQLQGLSGDKGTQLSASLMAAIAQGIDDGSEEALNSLRAFLSDWDQQFVLAVAGDKAQKAMDKAMEDFNRQFQDMDDSLKLQQTRTTAKSSMSQRHEQELRDFQQNQTSGETEEKRADADAALQRKRAFEDSEAANKLTEQHQLLTVTAYAQLTEKQKQDHIRQMQEQDAVNKYKAQQAAADTERKRKFEDQEREYTRSSEDREHNQKLTREQQLTQFKIGQQIEVEAMNIAFETEDYNRQVKKARALRDQRIADAQAEYNATHQAQNISDRTTFGPTMPDTSQELTPAEYAAKFGTGNLTGVNYAGLAGLGQGATGAGTGQTTAAGALGAAGNVPVPVEIVSDRTRTTKPKEFHETGEMALHMLSASDKEALSKLANTEQGKELRERMGNGLDYLTELLRILRSQGPGGIPNGGAASFLGSAVDPGATPSAGRVSPFAQAALNAAGNAKTQLEMKLQTDIPQLVRTLFTNPGGVTDVVLNGEALGI